MQATSSKKSKERGVALTDEEKVLSVTDQSTMTSMLMPETTCCQLQTAMSSDRTYGVAGGGGGSNGVGVKQGRIGDHGLQRCIVNRDSQHLTCK